jgi:hypothetical protein
MKSIALWIARKAAYTTVAAALTAGVGYMATAGGPEFDFTKLTMSGAIGGIGAAVFGDLRRKLMPDFLQVATGQDPREDG